MLKKSHHCGGRRNAIPRGEISRLEIPSVDIWNYNIPKKEVDLSNGNWSTTIVTLFLRQ